MANSVEIKNLDLSFGSVAVLKDLNLDISRGRVPCSARVVGLWKIHPAELHRRPVGSHGWTAFHQRQKRHLGRTFGSRHRDGVSILCAISADDSEGKLILWSKERQSPEG